MAKLPKESIKDLERSLARLRHDVRGLLVPAVLVAEALVEHGDPIIKRSGSRILGSIDRVIARLDETRDIRSVIENEC